MKRKYVIFLILGLLLIAITVWQIPTAQKGLEVIKLPDTNPPVTIIAPSNTAPASRPTVLIAHGFAGSSVLMRGFALTLAQAGYTTVSWDFKGHGENPTPLSLSNESSGLLEDSEAALAQAVAAEAANPDQVAILGHSMGSGVALEYGIVHPDTNATIAISPVRQTVTPELPRNLLLMAGSREQQFVANAKKLLETAGGENNNYSAGSARKLVIIPNVEHISILFS
ncbi:MAG: alpha/beta hydrolase, partial [Anaerolineae bacterium]|nr:alpha/beta hydrolase [Anaerolineae bacterium]